MKPLQGLHLSHSFIALVINGFSCAVVTFTDASAIVVDSPFGKIKGVENTDASTGKSYYSFKGIPYAKPPVGDLRFTKPELHPKIDDEFDATKEELKLCPHPDSRTIGQSKEAFTEDCLVLNILIAKASPPADSLKKVLVFFHGGAFYIGSGYFYDAKSFVIAEDVIVVTINYRLGVLGFLSTENKASLGNYGLWDQLMALKWVRDNIRAFGGDPHDVTISGESAGGASVTFHMTSPHSKGLFTKAYPQSGTSSSTFAQSLDAMVDALSIAISAGCWDKGVDYKLSLQESQDVVNCLRKVPLSVITAYNPFQPGKNRFLPRVDGDFVIDFPHKLYQDEDYLDSIGFFEIPLLIGVNNAEHTYMYNYLHATKAVIDSTAQMSKQEKESAWQNVQTAIKELTLLTRLGKEGLMDRRIVDEIDDFYNRRYVNFTSLDELLSDLNFLIPTLDYLAITTRKKSEASYFFYFNYFPQYMKGQWRGMSHALELCYWFDMDIKFLNMALNLGIEGEMSQEDLELKSAFSSIIGHFVRSGRPGQVLKNKIPSEWPIYDSTNSHFVNFNSHPRIDRFLEKDKYDFWLNIIPELMKNRQQQQLQHQHSHSEL